MNHDGLVELISMFHPRIKFKRILLCETEKNSPIFIQTLTSGGACMAKNESKPSSASKPDDSPGVTKSFDPQAVKMNINKYDNLLDLHYRI